MEGRSARAKQVAVPPDDPVNHDHQVVRPGGGFRRPLVGHRLPPVPSSQVTHSRIHHTSQRQAHQRKGLWEGELARAGQRGAHGKGEAALIRAAVLVWRIGTRMPEAKRS